MWTIAVAIKRKHEKNEWLPSLQMRLITAIRSLSSQVTYASVSHVDVTELAESNRLYHAI